MNFKQAQGSEGQKNNKNIIQNPVLMLILIIFVLYTILSPHTQFERGVYTLVKKGCLVRWFTPPVNPVNFRTTQGSEISKKSTKYDSEFNFDALFSNFQVQNA